MALCGDYQYGGITDWEKELSQLENKVKNSQEEMKSLHQIIQHLEKRLQIVESKGEFGEVQIQPVVPILHACQSGLSPIDHKVYELP